MKRRDFVSLRAAIITEPNAMVAEVHDLVPIWVASAHARARSKNYAYQNWKAHLSGALRPDCGLARLWEGPGRAARCPG